MKVIDLYTGVPAVVSEARSNPRTVEATIEGLLLVRDQLERGLRELTDLRGRAQPMVSARAS